MMPVAYQGNKVQCLAQVIGFHFALIVPVVWIIQRQNPVTHKVQISRALEGHGHHGRVPVPRSLIYQRIRHWPAIYQGNQ